jgi:hypothetical protein
LAGLAIAVVVLLAPATAHGNAFTPPGHRLFHGVTDTDHARDFRVFARRVRAHPALMQSFFRWRRHLPNEILHRWRATFDRWDATRTRGVISLSTAPGGKPEVISPRQIALGRGDHYILQLNREIADSNQVVYIRLFPEMNGHWNPYCAYNTDGSFRGRSHSTASFRDAWRRFVTIVRGGKRRKINRRLVGLGMPRMLRAHSNHARIYRRQDVPHVLPHPPVAFMWGPQTIASPDVAGNQPGDYWPGHRYVDWVGADIYSKFGSPGVWAALFRFYRKWDRWPFVIGEYSPWDNDYRGAFTRRLFNWAEDHHRVRAMIYYRSVFPNNIFDINHWPAARRVIRHHLNKHRWDPFAPGTRH